jgi:hypothetical protein
MFGKRTIRGWEQDPLSGLAVKSGLAVNPGFMRITDHNGFKVFMSITDITYEGGCTKITAETRAVEPLNLNEVHGEWVGDDGVVLGSDNGANRQSIALMPGDSLTYTLTIEHSRHIRPDFQEWVLKA